jgi:four helix bundle protein
LKEAGEAYYWIRLLYATDYLTEKEFISLESDIKEIIAILVSISNTNHKKA